MYEVPIVIASFVEQEFSSTEDVMVEYGAASEKGSRLG